MKRRKNTEASFHVQVAWLLNRILSPGVVWTTFPAGGGGVRRGVLLKKQGLKPGWPDIQLFDLSGGRWGLELKAPGGRLSPEQRKTHAELAALGWGLATCWDLNQVQEALREWGILRDA